VKARVSGLGLWVPPEVRTNDAWSPAFIAAARERGDRLLVDIPAAGDGLDAITAGHLAAEAADPFLGAVTRHVSVDEPAWRAEAAAGAAALADAGIAGEDLDAVLSWSIVADRPMLPSATRVAHELGARRAWATGADSGCASALVQLDLAAALVESGRARHVLLTQSHLITRAFPLGHPASPGVGDGATAMVISASESAGILTTCSTSQGEYWDAVTWVRGEAETDTPWYEAGGPFGPGSRNREGAKALMQHTVRFGVDTIREACRRAAVRPEAIGALASVQPRGWIPGAIAEGLGLDPALAPTTYARLAHLGGAGVVANLAACREAGLLRPGTLVALYAQGAGFTRSATLLRWEV